MRIKVNPATGMGVTDAILASDWCSAGWSHHVGDLVWAPDGGLYFSMGIAASYTVPVGPAGIRLRGTGALIRMVRVRTVAFRMRHATVRMTRASKATGTLSGTTFQPARYMGTNTFGGCTQLDTCNDRCSTSRTRI